MLKQVQIINLLFVSVYLWLEKQKLILPIPPNSAKHAFAFRKFSNLSYFEFALITATTEEYFAFSVSAYTAAVKLYVLIKSKLQFSVSVYNSNEAITYCLAKNPKFESIPIKSALPALTSPRQLTTLVAGSLHSIIG